MQLWTLFYAFVVGVLRYAINPLRSPDNRTESLPSTRIFHTENFPLRNYVLLANAKSSSRSTLCYRNHCIDCVLRRAHVTDATWARTILFRRFTWTQLSDTNCTNDLQTFLLSILRKRSQSLTFYLSHQRNISAFINVHLPEILSCYASWTFLLSSVLKKVQLLFCQSYQWY